MCFAVVIVVISFLAGVCFAVATALVVATRNTFVITPSASTTSTSPRMERGRRRMVVMSELSLVGVALQ